MPCPLSSCLFLFQSNSSFPFSSSLYFLLFPLFLLPFPSLFPFIPIVFLPLNFVFYFWLYSISKMLLNLLPSLNFLCHAYGHFLYLFFSILPSSFPPFSPILLLLYIAPTFPYSVLFNFFFASSFILLYFSLFLSSLSSYSFASLRFSMTSFCFIQFLFPIFLYLFSVFPLPVLPFLLFFYFFTSFLHALILLIQFLLSHQLSHFFLLYFFLSFLQI